MVEPMTTRSPRREVAYVGSDVLDDPHALVAEDRSRLHPGHRPPHEVQVGAADGARRELDDRVARLEHLRVGYLVEPDVSDGVKDDGLHVCSLIDLGEGP